MRGWTTTSGSSGVDLDEKSFLAALYELRAGVDLAASPDDAVLVFCDGKHWRVENVARKAGPKTAPFTKVNDSNPFETRRAEFRMSEIAHWPRTLTVEDVRKRLGLEPFAEYAAKVERAAAASGRCYEVGRRSGRTMRSICHAIARASHGRNVYLVSHPGAIQDAKWLAARCGVDPARIVFTMDEVGVEYDVVADPSFTLADADKTTWTYPTPMWRPAVAPCYEELQRQNAHLERRKEEILQGRDEARKIAEEALRVQDVLRDERDRASAILAEAWEAARPFTGADTTLPAAVAAIAHERDAYREAAAALYDHYIKPGVLGRLRNVFRRPRREVNVAIPARMVAYIEGTPDVMCTSNNGCDEPDCPAVPLEQRIVSLPGSPKLCVKHARERMEAKTAAFVRDASWTRRRRTRVLAALGALGAGGGYLVAHYGEAILQALALVRS